jgi:CDP-4-dehydro-6-deoxyglucose reductase
MQITITPSEHAFACEADETVLQAAMRADLMIPYGCRNGACGTCKGKIVSGTVDYGPYQPTTLTEDEKRVGLALFCCARPQTDLVIEVREVRRAGDIQIRRLPCRVESIDKPRADVADRALKLPANERLQYLAGSTSIPAEGRQAPQLLARHAPRTPTNCSSCTFRQVPEASFPIAVHAVQGPRDPALRGPLGTFYLREESDKPIIFVGRRHRLRAIKAVIEHALHHDDRAGAARWCFTGARSKIDLYLPDLPDQWQHRASRELHVSTRVVGAQTRGCVARAHRLRPPRGASTIFPTSPATRCTPAAGRR